MRQRTEKLQRIAQALDGDAQDVQRCGIVDARGRGELAHLAAQAADAACGKRGDGSGVAGLKGMKRWAMQQVPGKEYELAELGRAQGLGRLMAVPVAALGDQAHQRRQARFVGQRRHHRRGNFGQQHIHVARRAEQRGLLAQRRQQRGCESLRQQRRKESHGRAQAPRGDAHLVDVFGIVAGGCPLVVVLQML